MSPSSDRPDPPRDGDFEPGAVINNHYRLLEKVGEGAMGIVYRAWDLWLELEVALKFLKRSDALEDDARARLRNEVRLARAVSHRNVARVHDLGACDGRLFLTMEFVKGEDLASSLRRYGRLSHEKASEIAHQLCAGLSEAHRNDVLHRDLKPGNVMLDTRGNVRITDFGLAVLAGQDASLAGTPLYMAPEQLLNAAPASVKTEVYALGLLLYEIYTGQRALRGGGLAELRREHATGTPRPPAEVLPGLDPVVDRVLRECLERDPDHRPASVRAVALALAGGDPLAAAVAAGETPTAEDVASAGSGRGLAPKRALAVVLASAGLFAAIVALSEPLSIRLDYGLPQQSLRLRADELRARFARGMQAEDAVHWYELDAELDDAWFDQRRRAASDPTTPPPLDPLLHHSRYAPAPIAPNGARIDVRDPELAPGSVHLALNGDGRLLAWTWALPEDAVASGEWTEAGQAEILEAAGFLPEQLEAVAPRRIPRVFADQVHAWNLSSEDSGQAELHIELATLGSSPVQLEVSVGDHVVGVRPARQRRGWVLFGPLVVAASLVLAWRNKKLGRADLRGALRIGALGFAARLVLVLARPFPGGVRESLELLGTNLAHALQVGALAILLYLALEPLVRQRWPRALVSWSRLLADRPGDPMVGREVLLGALASSICFAAILALMTALEALGVRLDETPPYSCLGLEGPWQTLAVVANATGSAILAAASVTLILALLRALLHPPWLANSVWLALITPAIAIGSGISLPTFVFAASALVVLSRVGFLALVVFFFVFLGIAASPLTLERSDWYIDQSLAALAAYAALLAWGYRAATRGRSLFEPVA